MSRPLAELPTLGRMLSDTLARGEVLCRDIAANEVPVIIPGLAQNIFLSVLENKYEWEVGGVLHTLALAMYAYFFLIPECTPRVTGRHTQPPGGCNQAIL